MVLGLLDQLQIFWQFQSSFNRSGATQVVARGISKDFYRVWHAGLFHKLKSNGISGQIFGLIYSFLSNRRLQLQGSILGPILFLLYINDLPDDVICNIAIYDNDTTLFRKCDQVCDL